MLEYRTNTNPPPAGFPATIERNTMPKAANDNHRETELDRWHRLQWLAPTDPDLNRRLYAAGCMLRARAADNDNIASVRANDPTRAYAGGSRDPAALWPAEAAADRAIRGRRTDHVGEAERALGPLWPAVRALVLEDRDRRQIGALFGWNDRQADAVGLEMIRVGLWYLGNSYNVLSEKIAA
jgi:hypothetical protein